MIEDSQDDAALIANELKNGGFDVEYKRVATSGDLKGALTKNSWDVILCDHAMPKLCAPEAVGILRKNKITTPVIIVSGWITKDLAKATQDAGANGFVPKNELRKLVPTINKELDNASTKKANKTK